MSEEKNYIIGYDLGKKYAQISYVTFEGDEGDIYNIPVCLCKRQGANQWFYGEEAVRYAATGKGVLLEGLCDLAAEGKTVTVDDRQMDPAELLGLFIKNTLSEMGLYKEHVRIRALVVSVDGLTRERLTVLERIRNIAMAKFEGVYFESRVESLFYYTIHQPKELWSYEVGVMDFSEGYFKTYRVEMNHRSRPILTTITDEAYEDITLPDEKLSVMEKDHFLKQLDDRLFHIMEQFLEGRLVTSIYLTGKIFEKEWYPQTKKLICHNRRVFGGSNLYSKGACLGGMEKIAPGESAKAYLYLGKEKLKKNIGVLRMNQGKTETEILLDGGINWFEAKAEFEFIPGEDYKLPLVIVPLDGSKERIVPVILPQIKGRDLKSLKYSCTLTMKSETELSVVIEDLGFGAFYKPGGRKYEETILLGGKP